MASSKCKGGFKSTEGCGDPRTAARVPTQDQSDCGYVPGIYQSGYCECADALPRFVHCGAMPRRSCAQECAAPPQKSTLPGVDDEGSSAAPNNKPPAAPPFYTEPLFLGIVLVTFLVVAYQITRPATHERRRLQRLVDDQREDARVHQQIAQMLQS